MSNKKEKHLLQKFESNSGIIILFVLWILAILMILAIGLGQRTGIDFMLTKYAVGKLKSDYIAWAGVMASLNDIQKDTKDEVSRMFDTFFECGLKLEEGRTPEEIFKEIPLGDGHFTVGYISGDEKNSKQTFYGFQDEERKINLNAINLQNSKVFSSLVVLVGFDEEAAETVAASVIDWYDADSVVTNPPYGAEDEDYMVLSSPYHCKNAPFDSVEELRLVKGVTPEIFEALRDYLTVFPTTPPNLLVNMNTASEIVIQALGRSVAGSLTNTTLEDADSLASKIIAYRQGEDGEGFSQDDRQVPLETLSELGLNAKEELIFRASRGRMTNVSNYFRITVVGVDISSEALSKVEAVVSRDDLAIHSWSKE